MTKHTKSTRSRKRVKMAKKKVEVFELIENTKQLETILKRNPDTLICAEIYCSVFGPCMALDRLLSTMKFDWSDGNMLILRVQADDIEVFERFLEQSEPFFMFILNHRITQVFRGVDGIKLAEVAKKEIFYFKKHHEGFVYERRTYALNEMTPEEKLWHQARANELSAESDVLAARRAERQAARKRHRADRMAPHLANLNFVLYWPHATYAHPELYERWDMNNIIMVGREEIQLSEELAKDILYAGDAPTNEASMNALLRAPALVICFRLLDDDKHFVSLVRKILYEDIPPLDENKPLKDQPPPKTAFDLYKTYSPTRDEIWRRRREAREKYKLELHHKRARRLSEMQRLARQAIEDTLQARRQVREEKKLSLLKHGDLDGVKALQDEPENLETSIVIPEDLPDDIEVEEESEEEDEDEYFPPPGLLVPAFYSPPNDVAKANGLATLFPNQVLERVTPEPEFLPSHVLVMLHISKKDKFVATLAKYSNSIIHMGVFKAISPYNAKHIAYSLSEYNAMNLEEQFDTQILIMVSTANETALLLLTDLGPHYVSRDTEDGEADCAACFSVDYGDRCPDKELWFTL